MAPILKSVNFVWLQRSEMASVNAVQQHLNFSSSGEEDSSDNSFDEWAHRRVPVRSPSQTPRIQRHRTRSITISPSVPTSPIPYAAWKKLRLCDSPSTPKVVFQHFSFIWTLMQCQSTVSVLAVHYTFIPIKIYIHCLCHSTSSTYRVCYLNRPSLALAASRVAVKDSFIRLLLLTACPRWTLTLSHRTRCAGTMNATARGSAKGVMIMRMMHKGNAALAYCSDHCGTGFTLKYLLFQQVYGHSELLRGWKFLPPLKGMVFKRHSSSLSFM